VPLSKSTLSVLVGFITFGVASSVVAQSTPRTNVEILVELAVGCLGDVPVTLSSFILDSPERMPYLRPSLSSYWRESGKQVFLADTSAGVEPPAELFRLGYSPEDASIEYSEADGSKLNRIVSLSLRYRLLAPAGLLVDEGRCRDERSDAIARNQVLIVERDPYPETHGEIPPEGSWTDWAEPVALGAAIGVVAYLFFTVRSS
jgi:hypothetical protein